MVTETHQNLSGLELEINWLSQVIGQRMRYYFKPEEEKAALPPPPALPRCAYKTFVNQHQLSWQERLALALGLAPEIKPEALDLFFVKNQLLDAPYTEFGGIVVSNSRAFLPTGQTLAFLLSDSLTEGKAMLLHLIDRKHMFSQQQIFSWQGKGSWFNRAFRLSHEFLEQFTLGIASHPDYGLDFPAQYISTQLNWDDLVLAPHILAQVEEINTWLKHHQTVRSEWKLGAKMNPGYRVLFHGPSGTGKTLTACLLGKLAQRDVYRIDLSQVISKYIGETEKNLARVFSVAETKNWILFFDEADALFGQRTGTRSSNDRYANQEVAYLLQRIETFSGVAILATNLLKNMDDAFLRRFDSIVGFQLPASEERLLLWQKTLNGTERLNAEVNLRQLAQEHELTGASILNAVVYASLQTLESGSQHISMEQLQSGIRREEVKLGRVV